MSQPLLLDEMFSDDVAQQLRAKGYDVISVVADLALVGLPDDRVLAIVLPALVLALAAVSGAIVGAVVRHTRIKRARLPRLLG